MHGRQPGGPGPVVDDLVHAGRGHGPVAPDPLVRQVVAQPVLVADPQVAVERLSGLAADRQRPESAALAQPHTGAVSSPPAAFQRVS